MLKKAPTPTSGQRSQPIGIIQARQVAPTIAPVRVAARIQSRARSGGSFSASARSQGRERAPLPGS
jgi:hypothetical protein